MIESAIIGRPVLSLLSPEFHHGQEGTLHFGRISDQGTGIVRVATSLDQHLEHLTAALSGSPNGELSRRREFLERFVRPHGLDRPAAPILLEAIDQASSRPRMAARRRPVSSALLRRALAPAASRARRRRISTWRQADHP
jgi:hypothetical protein